MSASINEANQFAAKYKESERKTRAIFDLSFGFIGLLTPEGKLIEANQTALDFVGIKLEDVAGKDFWETPWWNSSDESKNTIKSVLLYGDKTNEAKIQQMRIEGQSYL